MFDNYRNASTCQEILLYFNQMCSSLNIDLKKYYAEKTTPLIVTATSASSYSSLKSLTSFSYASTRILYKVIRNKSMNYWKANSLWELFNKRLEHKDFNRKLKLKDVKILIIGCGPVGLRLSIELALLGLKVMVIEKRDR